MWDWIVHPLWSATIGFVVRLILIFVEIPIILFGGIGGHIFLCPRRCPKWAGWLSIHYDAWTVCVAKEKGIL